MLLGEIHERNRIMNQSNSDRIKELCSITKMPFDTIIKRFKQGWILTSPVQQYRNKENEKEALALRGVLKMLNERLDNMAKDDDVGFDEFTMAKNVSIWINDTLKEYDFDINRIIFKEFT